MQTTVCTSQCLLAPGGNDLSDEELRAAAGGSAQSSNDGGLNLCASTTDWLANIEL